MERSAQPHDVKDGATATRDRSETEGAPPPLHPHFTNDLSHPGHSGESDGTPPDPDASYENDVPGPIPLEPGRPQVAEQIDGAFGIDWFSVELDAGRTYVFHVRGEATGDGTLDDPAFGGLWFDPDGDGANLQPVSGYRQLDSGHGTNAVLTFTPAQSGTYCFAAFAQDWSLRSATGSYSVEVYDDTGAAGALIGTDSADRLDGDDEMHGRGGDDEIRGGDGDDFLVGGRDADWLRGGVGHDRLIGGPGDDTLWGGLGDDYVHGGDGADVLNGGAGNDSLIGGDGADVFWFTIPVAEDGTVLPFGDDVIYDFNAGEGDTLDFSRVYDHFPGLSVSVRPTEDGDIVATFTQTDGTPVGSVTLHRIAYQPVDGVPDPGPPHLPPEEIAAPGTPYTPPEEFADPYPPYVPWEEIADPGTPYTPPEEFADPYPPYVPWEEIADPYPPYVPWEEFADPGTPYAPPEEFADPGTPYVPWEEFADPGTPYAPPEEFGEAHGNPVDSGNPGIPDFLLPWVNLHAESVEADAM